MVGVRCQPNAFSGDRGGGGGGGGGEWKAEQRGSGLQNKCADREIRIWYWQDGQCYKTDGPIPFGIQSVRSMYVRMHVYNPILVQYFICKVEM